jgi:hypothetical protein
MKFAIIGLVILALVFGMFAITAQSDKQEIKEWAIQKRVEIVKIESCAIALGPYYFKQRHQRIYEVTLDNGSTYWFRFGLGYDVEKYPK